jgi:hypothetical protein
MKTHMKKLIFCLLLFTGSTAVAIKPSEWTILQRNYTYNNSVVQRAILTSGLEVLDMAVTSDNRLWILTNKDLYVLREQGNDLSLDHPLETKNIRYREGAIPPRIYADHKNGGLTLLTGDKYWTTNDYQQWSEESVKPEEYIASAGPHFTQATEMFMPSSGKQYMAGLYGKMPGIMSYSPDDGPAFYFPSDDYARPTSHAMSFGFRDLHRGKNQTLWMRGNIDRTDLWKLHTGTLRYVAGNVTAMASDDDGEIYVATNNALYKIDDYGELVKLRDVGARYMVCDKKGFLWFVPIQQVVPPAKPDVLIKYNPKTGAFFRLTSENCPIKGAIGKIVVDNNNVKYILTRGVDGIYIISDAPVSNEDWEIITTENGSEVLNENYWEALYKGENGNYISLSQDKKFGLMFFENNQWTPVKTYDKPRGFFEINDIVEHNEKIYLAARYGFYRLENDRFEMLKDYDKKQLSYRINAVLKDDENNLWLGSSKGIAKFDGEQYTYFNKKNTPALADESILNICSDRDKKIFFGTTDGLAVLDKDNWTFYDKKTGLDSKKVVAVASNSKGQTFIASVPFIGTTNVISIYEGGQLHNESLPEKILVEKMLVDNHDNLWIQAHASLVCRNADGKYIYYDFKNSPIPKDLVIKDIFLFEDELRVLIDEYALDKDDGLPKYTQPANVFGMDVNKFQLNTFISTKQVLIYDTKRQK